MSIASATIRDLEDKEVINLCDGAVLGFCVDFEIDVSCARIVALHVRRGGGWFSFKAAEPIRVLWNQIECIGDETILVRIPTEEICPTCRTGKHHKL